MGRRNGLRTAIEIVDKFSNSASLPTAMPTGQNQRLEPLLITIALWLAVAVVLAFAFAGCAVPLR
jgi:hypothetical protein